MKTVWHLFERLHSKFKYFTAVKLTKKRPFIISAMQKPEFTEQETRLLTQAQRNICEYKASHTWNDTVAHFHLSSRSALSTVISRTAQGRVWHPGMTGRGDPLLGEVDTETFSNILEKASLEENLISSQHGLYIVSEILCARRRRYAELMKQMKCYQMAQSVNDVPEPTIAWLEGALKKIGYQLKTQKIIEESRRIYCHSLVIYNFYRKLAGELPDSPLLIFNMDETSLQTNRNFKAIVQSGAVALTTEKQASGHITVACCFNADNYSTKPFVILPNLQNVPADMQGFRHDVTFASSESGWMTANLFTIWCLHFVSEMSRYRQQVLKEYGLENRTITLIVDGHGSRINFNAAYILRQNNIKLICLPPHCTHAIQPFDLSLASPIKNQMKKNLENWAVYYPKAVIYNGHPTAKMRYLLVAAFLDAWRSKMTRSCITKAWRDTGLFPLDAEIPIKRTDLVRPTNANDNLLLPSPRKMKIGQKVLTSDDMLVNLFNFEKKASITTVNEIIPPNVVEVIALAYQQDLAVGKSLVPVPPWWVRTEDGRVLYSNI